jgi:hypothetical protein
MAEHYSLYDNLIKLGFEPSDFEKSGGILLQNDGDGDYIKEWNSPKPLPEGMKVGKN